MNIFDSQLLAKRMREKRGSRSLRDIAAELDIGIATLSRIENGKLPDLHNFGVIFQWLGDNPAIYFQVDASGHSDDQITTQLRAAQAISPETASAFMKIIRAGYAQILNQISEDMKSWKLEAAFKRRCEAIAVDWRYRFQIHPFDPLPAERLLAALGERQFLQIKSLTHRQRQ